LCTVGGCGGSTTPSQRDKTIESGSEKGRDLNASVSQCGETRLTFHTSLEVPQLRQWFRINPKPSDRILLKYAQILNQSSLRQERYYSILSIYPIL
jgi:hypothetical protein